MGTDARKRRYSTLLCMGFIYLTLDASVGTFYLISWAAAMPV